MGDSASNLPAAIQFNAGGGTNDGDGLEDANATTWRAASRRRDEGIGQQG
jgi:hypothetical protein